VGRRPTATGGSCTATAPAACSDSGIGDCQGRGQVVCAAGGSQTTCRITQPGAAPVAETCDGRDNNCDGTIDNGDPADPARVREPMVAISGGALAAPVYMYAYEASRPDATSASAGSSPARACARAGVLPWSNVTYPEAVAACRAAGKRLCTEAEWQRACETSASKACDYAFGQACDTAALGVCNTEEHDGDAATAGDQSLALPTGALPMCYASWGDAARIHDLTGNLKEWTQATAPGQNPVRGGAFDTVLDGASCTFRFALFDDRFRYASTGFRCCADAP
jgi:formylglycine-generating enzyme required for sulfatase activity